MCYKSNIWLKWKFENCFWTSKFRGELIKASNQKFYSVGKSFDNIRDVVEYIIEYQ